MGQWSFYRRYDSNDSTYVDMTVTVFPTISELGWIAPEGKRFKYWTVSGVTVMPGEADPWDAFPPLYPPPDGGRIATAVWEDIPEDISTITLPNGTTYAFKDETARNLAEGAIQAPDSATAGDSLIFNGTDWSAGDTTFRSSSIPFGKVDSTSTSTVYTATVPGITDLHDGVNVFLMNGVVTSAANFTININNLGAKPVYSTMAAASRATTLFNVNYTLWLVYNSQRVSGGCWDAYYGYDSNTNTVGYQVRTNSLSLPMSDYVGRYRIMFTSADGEHFVPSTTSTSTNATASRAVCQTPIDPFGRIVYYSSTTAVSAGSRPGAGSLWQQYAVTFGYSFNRTGAALTLTSWKPIYIKCAPQSDGSAIIDAETPYVQDLPTTADGKIYIFLGIAYSATAVELTLEHPVYEYKNGRIQQYTNHKYTAADVGAIPAPASPSEGDSLIFDGTDWVAQASSDENDYVWKLDWDNAVEIAAEQTVSFTLDAETGLYVHDGELDGFKINQQGAYMTNNVFSVTFDGVEYVDVLWRFYFNPSGNTIGAKFFCGNSSLLNYRNPYASESPFLLHSVYDVSTQSYLGKVYTSLTEGTHTISVKRIPVDFGSIYHEYQPLITRGTSGNGIVVGEAIDCGNQGIAIGQASKSTGSGTAIGNRAVCDATVSVAVGTAVKANGTQAVALGVGAFADAANTIAVGASAYANENPSAAIGCNVTADSAGQTVLGRYNVTDSNGAYAFILGDGTANNSRKNLFTIAHDGTVVSNGKILATTDDVGAVEDQLVWKLDYENAVEIVAEQSVSFSLDSTTNLYKHDGNLTGLAWTTSDIEDYVYDVTWDGTTYRLIMWQLGEAIPNDVSRLTHYTFLGNTGLLDYRDPLDVTAPFVIAHSAAATTTVAIYTSETTGSHSVSITRYPVIFNPIKKSMQPLVSVDSDESVAIGGTKSVGFGGVGIGVGTVAGQQAISIGTCAEAGRLGISIGTHTKATNYYSTAIGYTSEATGAGATAIGASKASGQFAVGLGVGEATATRSVAMSLSTAASAHQTTTGKWNVVDSSDTYAFIIGDGTADNARHNLFTIGWNGTVTSNGNTLATTNDIPDASDATPQALGTASAGSSDDYSRADHVHAKPTASQIGAIAEPSTAGTSGQVLSLDSNLDPVWTTPASGTVTDVKVNNTSVTSSGVANIPVASTSDFGVIKFGSSNASIAKASDGYPYVVKATDAEVKAGTNSYKPIVPGNQRAAVFYGLAEASGDSTQASSSNAVGTYTDTAKTKIKTMLGISDGLPAVTSADNGKVLMVVDGYWQAATPSGSSLPSANGVSF